MLRALAGYILGGILNDTPQEPMECETKEVNDWLVVNMPDNHEEGDIDFDSDTESVIEEDDILECIPMLLPFDEFDYESSMMEVQIEEIQPSPPILSQDNSGKIYPSALISNQSKLSLAEDKSKETPSSPLNLNHSNPLSVDQNSKDILPPPLVLQSRPLRASKSKKVRISKTLLNLTKPSAADSTSKKIQPLTLNEIKIPLTKNNSKKIPTSTITVTHTNASNPKQIHKEIHPSPLSQNKFSVTENNSKKNHPAPLSQTKIPLVEDNSKKTLPSTLMISHPNSSLAKQISKETHPSPVSQNKFSITENSSKQMLPSPLSQIKIPFAKDNSKKISPSTLMTTHTNTSLPKHISSKEIQPSTLSQNKLSVTEDNSKKIHPSTITQNKLSATEDNSKKNHPSPLSQNKLSATEDNSKKNHPSPLSQNKLSATEDNSKKIHPSPLSQNKLSVMEDNSKKIHPSPLSQNKLSVTEDNSKKIHHSPLSQNKLSVTENKSKKIHPSPLRQHEISNLEEKNALLEIISNIYPTYASILSNQTKPSLAKQNSNQIQPFPLSQIKSSSAEENTKKNHPSPLMSSQIEPSFSKGYPEEMNSFSVITSQNKPSLPERGAFNINPMILNPTTQPTARDDSEKLAALITDQYMRSIARGKSNNTLPTPLISSQSKPSLVENDYKKINFLPSFISSQNESSVAEDDSKSVHIFPKRPRKIKISLVDLYSEETHASLLSSDESESSHVEVNSNKRSLSSISRFSDNTPWKRPDSTQYSHAQENKEPRDNFFLGAASEKKIPNGKPLSNFGFPGDFEEYSTIRSIRKILESGSVTFPSKMEGEHWIFSDYSYFIHYPNGSHRRIPRPPNSKLLDILLSQMQNPRKKGQMREKYHRCSCSDFTCHPILTPTYLNHRPLASAAIKTDIKQQIKELQPSQKAKSNDLKRRVSRAILNRQNKNNMYCSSAKTTRRKDLQRNHSGANNNRKC